MADKDRLAPPPAGHINPEHDVPLSPAIRPPFQHYHSSSTLPPTPHTPYPNPALPPRSATTSMTQHPSTPLTPYLTLAPRLLLATISPALLPLVLSIAHLLQNRSSTDSLAETLRDSLLSACAGLAKGATSLQTIPRYLAIKTNEQMMRTSQAMILAVGKGLMDIITIINVVVEFMVDTYRSLLLCTIELAVRGTLEVMIGAVRTITDGVQSSLNTIRDSIQNDVASANRFIRSTIERVNNLFSSNISVPELNVPSLSALENVQIPTGFEDALVRLNTTLPTLSELKDKMAEVLAIPFDRLKIEINETRLELAASLNTSILPTPPLSSLSAQQANDLTHELCSDLDTSVIDDTAKALNHMSTVAVGLMFLILFLCWAALCIWEWRRYRAMKQAAEKIEREWQREKTMDVYRVVAIVENPVLERYGSQVLHRVAPNQRTRMNLRWYMAYLAHPTCLALLCVALLGFLMLQFQILALNAIKDHARANANSTVAATSSSLAAKMNAMAADTSAEYARDFNAAIARHQQRIDEELFGKWINTTAITLNATVGEFYDDVENALNATFGGTILFNPMNTFLYCILGSKVDNLQAALNWLSENARVTLPTVPENILMLSDESMAEMASPIAAAAVGTSDSEDDHGVVGRLIQHFETALVWERNFYAILLGVWLGLALIGLLVVLWHSGGRDKYHSWRGTTPNDDSGHGRKGPTIAWPGSKDDHPIYDNFAEKEFRGLSPSRDIPQIVEPGTGSSETNARHQRTSSSFFNYNNRDSQGGDDTPRPFVPRKGTFGNSMSSLIAPGQAFLKMTGRSTSQDDKDRLVEKGESSEKYTRDATAAPALPYKQEADDGLETPPPFWVNRFYGVLKSLFPTRGQKHGAALDRSGSQRTDQSLGASRMASALTPQGDWAGDDAGSRYPQTPRGPLNHDPFSDTSAREYQPHPAAHTIYPRPLSRAPTLSEGSIIPRAAAPPPVPIKIRDRDSVDSVDYLDTASDRDDDPYNDQYEEKRFPLASPASSSQEYFGPGPVVGSAQKVDMHRTPASALAEIINRKQLPEGHGARYI